MTENGNSLEPADSPPTQKRTLKAVLKILIIHAVVIVYTVFAVLKYIRRSNVYTLTIFYY